jgi:hypothetical protein
MQLTSVNHIQLLYTITMFRFVEGYTASSKTDAPSKKQKRQKRKPTELIETQAIEGSDAPSKKKQTRQKKQKLTEPIETQPIEGSDAPPKKKQKRQKKKKPTEPIEPQPVEGSHETTSPAVLTQEQINERNSRLLAEQGQKAVTTALENRPKNTTKAYKKAQSEWVSFCSKWQFEDGEFVTSDKLLWFTNEIVLERRVRLPKTAQSVTQSEGLLEEDTALVHEIVDGLVEGTKDNPKEQDGTPLKYNTVRLWVSAVMDLYHVQIARGLHSLPSPKGFGVKGALKDVQAKTFQRIRELHEDRALNTILDSYTKEDLHAFVSWCWQKATVKDVESYQRTLLDFLMGHYFLVRGDQRRRAELADMFILHLPNESATQQCMCWIFVFDNGKTNSTGRKQYLGSIRHRDPLVCPIGALAFYLFTRFHYKKEAWPSLHSLKDWDRIKLLRGGSDREHALNEKTHREWINRVFEGIGFSSSKSTHAGRRTGAQWAEILGVPEDEVRVV